MTLLGRTMTGAAYDQIKRKRGIPTCTLCAKRILVGQLFLEEGDTVQHAKCVVKQR